MPFSNQIAKGESREFPIWKTITIGIWDTVREARRSILKGNFEISKRADEMLEKVKLAAQKIDLDLVLVTNSELGFKDGATKKQVYDRSKSFGLELCPQEVGPILRCAFPDQPEDYDIHIAMEPITCKGNIQLVFVIQNGCRSGRFLDAIYDRPDQFWVSNLRWVFVQPHK